MNSIIHFYDFVSGFVHSALSLETRQRCLTHNAMAQMERMNCIWRINQMKTCKLKWDWLPVSICTASHIHFWRMYSEAAQGSCRTCFVFRYKVENNMTNAVCRQQMRYLSLRTSNIEKRRRRQKPFRLAIISWRCRRPQSIKYPTSLQSPPMSSFRRLRTLNSASTKCRSAVCRAQSTRNCLDSPADEW